MGDAGLRRPTRPRSLTCVTTVMFWRCFTPIGIIHVVILPPGETFDRSLFMNIVMDGLKKKLVQIPDPNPEKGHVLHKLIFRE
jgi:hypothetical protein